MGPQIDSVIYERPLSGRDNPYGLPILIMRWYFLLAAVAIFGFKQLLEARENAAVAGPGWWVVGIPGRWSSGLHLPPATGRGARGGASGQCQPQPYGINLIGGLFYIWLHGGGVVTPQQYRKGGVSPTPGFCWHPSLLQLNWNIIFSNIFFFGFQSLSGNSPKGE